MAHPDFAVEPFQPAWWAKGQHMQSAVSFLLRSKGDVDLHRERLTTPDGDFLDLDYAVPQGKNRVEAGPRTPIILLIHGMEGSSRSGYMYESYRQLAELGIRSIGMNFRSCSGEMNRTPFTYHPSDTRDLSHVLDLLAERNPGARLGVIGFSIGGNILLKYLGESDGGRGRVSAAVTVSTPFELSADAENLAKWPQKIYTNLFLQKLRKKARYKVEAHDLPLDIEAIKKVKTLRQFDEAYGAHVMGVDDLDELYARASSARFLSAIRAPTLILRALDDPFYHVSTIPYAAIKSNPFLCGVFPEHGGHLGFMEGRSKFWAERQAARFLKKMLFRGH